MEGKMEIRTDAGGRGEGGLDWGNIEFPSSPLPPKNHLFPSFLSTPHITAVPPPPPPLEKQEEAPFGTGRLRGTSSSTSTAPEQGFR